MVIYVIKDELNKTDALIKECLTEQHEKSRYVTKCEKNYGG
jgi:hypothetical protein